MIPRIPFYFVRHGETDWNTEGRSMGQTDIPLNDTGRLQAHKTAKILQNTHFGSIFTSPLERTVETARILQGNRDCPLNTHSGLIEACWGVNEGKLRHQINIDGWINGDHVEGSETFDELIFRTQQCFKEILETAIEPVLIVSHGGIGWALQRILGHALYRFENAQAGFFQPNPQYTGWSLELF